jgi:O-antigen/teichoic acid export membrane protein
LRWTTGITPKTEKTTSITYRAAAGVIAGGYVISFLLKVVTNIVLARLLLPEVFGVSLLITSMTVLLVVLTDVGIGVAVLRNANSDRVEFRGTLWSLQFLQGLALAILLLVIAGGLQWIQGRGLISEVGAFGTKDLPAILLLYALGLAIGGARSLKLFFAQKHLQQNLLIRNELILHGLSSLITCGLAWWLGSLWALGIAAIIGQILSVLLSHFALPGSSDEFRWSTEVLKKEWPFAKWVWVSSGLGVIATQADKFLLGALLTATTLGFFSLAAGLIAAVEGGLSRVLGALGVPAITKLVETSREELLSKFTFVATWTERVTFFLVGSFAVAGESIVRLLYPPNFHESGVYIAMLSAVITGGRVTLSTQLFLALGRSKYHAFLSACKFAFSIFFVLLGYYIYGIRGAVLGVSAQALAVLLASLMLEARLGVEFKTSRYLSIISALMLGAIAGWCGSIAIEFLTALLLS